MKRIWMMIALLASVVGCGQLQIPKVILVTPLNEQDVLDAKAAALIAANTEPVADAPQDDETKPSMCLCGGTGRSGDGLGPCACPDGCRCKPQRQEVLQSTDAVKSELDEEQDTVSSDDALDTVAAEPSDEQDDGMFKILADMEGRIGQIVKINGGVIEATENLVAKTAEIDQRLKAVEAMTTSVKKESPQQDASPKRQLLLFYTDKDLEALDAWETEHGTKLVDVGWSIGNDETFQICKLRIESPEAGQYPQASDLAKKNGTPYWALVEQQAFQRGAVGLPAAKQVSDMLNNTQPAVTASATSSEPWKLIAETWPARVPISGTTMPSKQTVIWHLRGGGTGGENHRHQHFTEWPLESMTVGQLVTLHDSAHPIAAQKNVQYVQPNQVKSRGFQLLPRNNNVSFRQRTCVNGKCF